MSQFVIIKYFLQRHCQFQIKGYSRVPQKTCSSDPVVHFFKHQIILKTHAVTAYKFIYNTNATDQR